MKANVKAPGTLGKKMLSLLLSLVLVVGLAPATPPQEAWAEEGTVQQFSIPSEEAGQLLASEDRGLSGDGQSLLLDIDAGRTAGDVDVNRDSVNGLDSLSNFQIESPPGLSPMSLSTKSSNQYWHFWSEGDPFTLGNDIVIKWEDVTSTAPYAYAVSLYDPNGTCVGSHRYPSSGTYEANQSWRATWPYKTTLSQPSGRWRASLVFYDSSGAQTSKPEISFFVKDTPITASHNLETTTTVSALDSHTFYFDTKGSNIKYQWYWNTT
ncbi:MAG: hypothetical protein IJ131_08155, partial [Eggerthellaceae bacterium]|nr:hypothetical protein [Eggerthellaceae bacterium]